MHVATVGTLPRMDKQERLAPNTPPYLAWRWSCLADPLAHVNPGGSKSASPVDMMCAFIVGGNAQPNLFKTFFGKSGFQSAQRSLAIAIALMRWKNMEITDESRT